MATRKEAIDAYCKECGYDDLSQGTWRKQIEECTVTHCPLFEWRPITSATKREQNGVQPQPEHA